MTVAGAVDVALDIFGGLVSDMSAADIPSGVSPDCQNVAFVPGAVKIRPGLQSMFSPIAGNPTINYLKSYIPPSGLLRLLVLDAAGSLWKESPQGSLSLISSAIVPASFGKSASLFTREYIAFGDGQNGIDIPRQFDDTNLDRVSQVGPGQAPGIVDEVVSVSLKASPNGLLYVAAQPIAASPTGLVQIGNTVTVTMTSIATAATGFKIGDNIVIAGAGVAGYNGTWPITAILGPVTFQVTITNTGLAASGGGTVDFGAVDVQPTTAENFVVGESVAISGAGVATYNATWAVRLVISSSEFTIYVGTAGFGLANSGNGSVAAAGNISAGKHGVSVVFKTRQGYITGPAPPTSWTAGGGKRVIVSSIPIGPPNVIARILIFTLAGQTSYFYSGGITGIFSSNFIINDNTTTSVTVDFTDVGLAAQTNADDLFRLDELGECSGVISYASRLFWWGERNKVQNALNLTFDGGFGGTVTNFPLGWVQDATNYAGGGIGASAVWGQSYRILGNGNAICGKMAQGMYQDAFGVPIIQPNTAYSVRVRVIHEPASANFTQGTLHINMQSTIGAFTTTGISLAATTFGTTFAEYTASILSSQATIPTDLVLQVYMDGTPTNGAQLSIDNIEIFPTNTPINASLIRASKVEDPESYDGVTGFMLVNDGDGFNVRAAFVLRENLYFVKDQGIYSTQDDGQNEPSLWRITEVSRKIGTPSINGVAVGEDWAVVAHRTGLYITNGGEPLKISQEIQPTWDRINWAAGKTVWVQVDTQNKRILVGVPLDSATSPNTILMLDYHGMESAGEIADGTPIHISYSGKLLVRETSRKWAPWTITANCGALVERFDGTLKMWVGNGAGNGKVYQLSDSQLGSDDGTAISAYYTTYFHFTHDLEQALQIGAHNKLFTYLALFVEGSGQLVVSAVPPGGTASTVTAVTLSNPSLRDIELPINVTASRSAFKVGVSNLGEWFRLQRFIVDAIKHPSAPVRGWN